MASASAKTNANYIALELAAPFLCPRIGALAATCKDLRTASLSTITWTPFFRRRWPCLAAVEHFAAPTDARALVKGLLRAVPPPLDSELPECPCDAAGRALPLCGEVILAVQLSVRSTGHAFAYGARRLSELDLHHPFARGQKENEIKNWDFVMPLAHIDEHFVDGEDFMWFTDSQLAQLLSLPHYIAISPERGLVAAGNHKDTNDDGCWDDPHEDPDTDWRDPDEVIPNLLETACRQFDANLLSEIYVVAGDDIWLLSQEDDEFSIGSDADMDQRLRAYHRHFKRVFQAWQAGDAPSDDDCPSLPVVRHKNFDSFEAQWTLATYTNIFGKSELMRSMRHNLSPHVHFRFCAWWAQWDHEVRHFDDAAAADAAEHECLCQLLATTRPVRFPRRQQAA